MATSSIEWTEQTWNPTVGCDKISPGCKHCYAEVMHARLTTMGQKKYAEPFNVVKPYPDHLTVPLRVKKPTTFFVNSMSDLFHEDVPDKYIAAVFGVMAATPQHTYQVLTKRAERLPRWFDLGWIGDDERNTPAEACRARAMNLIPHRNPDGSALKGPTEALFGYDTRWPLPNVWMGVSVENQRYADERIPELLKVPAAVRFLSVEPLLEPVDLKLSPMRHDAGPRPFKTSGIDWVIGGFESGHGARPGHLEWMRTIVRDCAMAGVACFVKQLGSHPRGLCMWPKHDKFPPRWLDSDGTFIEVSKRPADDFCHSSDDSWWPCKLDLKGKGGDMDQWPEDLRVRQYPAVRT